MDLKNVWCPPAQTSVDYKAEAHPDQALGKTDVPTLIILDCSWQRNCKIYELRWTAQYRDKCRISTTLTVKLEEATQK